MRLRRPPHATEPRPAYVLVAVLVVVVILSLAAYRFTDAMTSEFAAAARTADATQTKAFAASGVHYAMGLLSDPAAVSGTLNNNPYDNPNAFSAQPLGTDTRRGGARFSLIAVGDTGTGSGESRYAQRFGVTDEAGKINLNAFLKLDPSGDTLAKALLNLPNMTPEVADAVVDWLDADDEPRPAGAESAYYQGLSPPYRAKNGPVNSVDELLLVQGVTPQLLYGSDRNRNGVLDANEDASADFGRGWADFLTAYGHEIDASADGVPRVFLNDPELDAPALYEELLQVLPPAMADYVLAVRLWGQTALSTPPADSPPASGGGSASSSSSGSGSSSSGGSAKSSAGGSGSAPAATLTVALPGGTADQLSAAVQAALGADTPPSLKTKIKSVGDLLNSQVTLPAPKGVKNPPTVKVASPLAAADNAATMLGPLLEYTTANDPGTGYDMTPRINVVTAPPEVLLGIPGMTAEDASAIVTARAGLDPADPTTTTAAFLVTAAKLSPAKFAGMARYVTGRTMVYRVHSVGHFANGGPVARVEAVIDTNGGTPRIVSYRDVSDLGPGFTLTGQ